MVERSSSNPASRPLTSGEIELAKSVFADAIDYSRVRMVRRKWWPFQPRNVAMAPTGNIHFHPHSDLWSEDFAREPLHRQGLFIHELTHVWQTQHRGRFYLPLMRHPFCRYRYDLVPGRPFDRYGLEQQAEIVRDRFLADRGRARPVCPPAEILPFSAKTGL
ncbi:vgr related protein [Sphingomonas sp. SM33]|uniref:Vgr related protein n=1 Tax=Sphingomonas telluris TaxID=2907998 RepID=A0ABS9VKS4_9SPHN|nr:vgr related protein [Sphingomonas telluris]MCH8615017.1 vgr related protein [Sphingomonas telluris]